MIVQLVSVAAPLAAILGAAIALFKLRPEVNQMAVTSATQAGGEWQKLYAQCKAELDETETERDAWRDRALRAESDLAKRGQANA